MISFKKKKIVINEIPTIAQLEKELQRENYKNRYGKMLRSTTYTLITVSAVAILVATLLMPVLRIYGMSMTPSLSEGNIVITLKGSEFNQGDVISFYYNNKILVKRVIAFPGQWVDIDKDGNIYVNEDLLDEPYLTEKALGECDIELPYQVPDGKIFVCGDHRSTSVDSRSTTVGCVSEEQIVGKILFKVWPLNEMGPVK
ncbi:MAG: signal peptidase I [Acutalibacteraceae bacterium]|nr:signal peptidase I [Acutalibacteraceae bacterium]